jgi:16S rRNA (uracil1498-N3)-methyltransferase
MHRFFVSPAAIQGDRVRISGPAVHQIKHVLRLRPGQRFVVLDDSGWEYTAELVRRGQKEIGGRILARAQALGEPRTRITLFQAVLKGERFEWVLQKGSELGIAAFVPLLCDRNVVRGDAVLKKLARWRTIIREAAEQSRRGRLPRLELPLDFAAACQQAQAMGGLSLLAWEEETALDLKAVLYASSATGPGPADDVSPAICNIQLFIGPEGGFTPQEAMLATDQGIQPVTLGPRILRAETAGLVAAAALFYELGDLGRARKRQPTTADSGGRASR